MTCEHCEDPTFLGAAVYVTIGPKTRKLSRLVSAQELPDGSVVIKTLNSTYRASFTDELTRSTFLKTCATIGRLQEQRQATRRHNAALDTSEEHF